MGNMYTDLGFEKIGTCGVDSGQIMLVDPCYVMRDEEWADSTGNQTSYQKLLHTWEQNGWDKASIGFQMGVVVGSGYGDGVYNVYGLIRNGRCMAVLVDFENIDADTCENCGQIGEGTYCSDCESADAEDDDE